MSKSLESLSVVGWDSVGVITSLLTTIVVGVVGYQMGRRGRNRQELEFVMSYRRDVLAFVDEFCNVIGRALSLISKREYLTVSEFETDKADIQAQISAMVDRGRFLFPNDVANKFGSHKGKGFEGYRSRELNRLLASYFAVGAIKKEDEIASVRSISIEMLMDAKDESCDLSEVRDSVRHLSKESHSRLSKKAFSVYDVLVEARREFVNEVWEKALTRQWQAGTSSVFDVNSRLRPEIPYIMIDRRN